MLGIDVLNVGTGFFSDRKLYQAFLSTEIKPKLHGVIDVGVEKNKYDKNNYNASANGVFMKLGTYYMLIADPENRNNGFYVGGKMAGSLYTQEYFAIPVKGFLGGDDFVSFPSSKQSAYWLEAIIGARVQLFSTPLYVDANFQPKYLVYTTKQENIQPMILPGFGSSSSPFGTGFSWSLIYHF